ncbi:hypothetical protein V490_04657 [Pseudogymnoascus sp. VKM F-3557]|nr:hypothetical protein V490_04657 [Pseudogymnoascus sp. VKM F-3557]
MAKPMFKNLRVYILASVAYLGSFLFGYDTGVMGSVLALESFKKDFGLPTDSSGFADSRNAEVSSNVVSLLTAGCFFGAIGAAFANEKFGRRYTLMVLCVIFLIGAAVQTAATHQLSYIYAGRVVAGLGIGGMSAITPVFVAENCPAEVRGRITGLFQEFLVIGVTVAYWVNYGVSRNLAPSTTQWRIPVGLQMAPGAIMLIGLIFLKESPRWLVKQGRYDEATASLAYMRHEEPGSLEVQGELAEIRASIEDELAATEGVTWKEIFKPGNRTRFLNGFLIMFWQQWSGTNSIGYYAPQVFQTIGIAKTDTSLFATGIYGIVKVVATGIFLIVGIDKVGRRWSLIAGAAWMSAMMFILGAILTTHPPTDINTVSPASIAMIVMIYLYVIGYSASWGPIPWVYLSEIFPTRLRAYGVGMGSATQWLFNFVITRVTPAAINKIGWRTFIMFGCFCLAMGVWIFFFVQETKGRTLEEMDILFGTVDMERRRDDIEYMMQKTRVVEDEHVAKADNRDVVELENRRPEL